MQARSATTTSVVDGPRGPVRYLRCGTSDAALLLLAGVGSTARLWGELPPLLAARGFTVLAPDNRGVGGSRAGAPFTLAGAAADAALVVSHAGFARAAVLGVSMGGLIACHLAVDSPASVTRLVAASCAARSTPSHRRVLRFFRTILTRLEPIEAAELLMTFAFAAPFADLYPGFVSEAARLWAPEPADLAGIVAQLDHLESGFDISPRLSAIAVPTLVVAGAQDPIVPASASRELAMHIPAARFLEVPAAAHSVLAEGGAAILEATVAFLDGREDTPGGAASVQRG